MEEMVSSHILSIGAKQQEDVQPPKIISLVNEDVDVLLSVVVVKAPTICDMEGSGPMGDAEDDEIGIGIHGEEEKAGGMLLLV